jgi:hypothetical protein
VVAPVAVAVPIIGAPGGKSGSTVIPPPILIPAPISIAIMLTSNIIVFMPNCPKKKDHGLQIGMKNGFLSNCAIELFKYKCVLWTYHFLTG